MSGISPEQAKQLPFDLYRDGYEYYLQTHAHPGSTFRYTKSSLMDLMAFDASEGMYLINQPLLMMAGSLADTFYMTEQCFSKATGTQQSHGDGQQGTVSHPRRKTHPDILDAGVCGQGCGQADGVLWKTSGMNLSHPGHEVGSGRT